jgi:hypothetical protein
MLQFESRCDAQKGLVLVISLVIRRSEARAERTASTFVLKDTYMTL